MIHAKLYNTRSTSFLQFVGSPIFNLIPLFILPEFRILVSPHKLVLILLIYLLTAVSRLPAYLFHQYDNSQFCLVSYWLSSNT